MTPDKEKELYARYPRILRDMYGNEKQTCMAWGLAVGDGWFNIIDCLCSSIQSHVDHTSRGKSPEEAEALQVVAEQVKAKFGGLRFYARGGDETVRGMIYLAEALSYKTCEDCGAPAVMKDEGAYRVQCSVCASRTKNWDER